MGAQDVLDKLNALDDAGWKKIITDSLAAATAVTLDDAAALAVTTINGATKALTTTTSTTSSTTGATTAYVAMSKITGALSMTATESDCLNMKDAAGATALAGAIKTISTAPAAAKCVVTTDCTTKTSPVVTYEIHTPTAGTPTPTAIKAVIDGVSAADWDTKLTKAIKDAPLTEPAISAVTQSTAATITSITTMGPTTFAASELLFQFVVAAKK